MIIIIITMIILIIIIFIIIIIIMKFSDAYLGMFWVLGRHIQP